MKAQVVYETARKASVNYGSIQSDNVGFEINGRVFWVGACFSGPGQAEGEVERYRDDEALAKSIVAAINFYDERDGNR